MENIAKNLFWNTIGLEPLKLQTITESALYGADDGELYLEYTASENYHLDDNVLKTASSNLSQGFGLRAISGESVGYYHSTAFDENVLMTAAKTVRDAFKGQTASIAHKGPTPSRAPLYIASNPLTSNTLKEKVSVLEFMNEYIRAQNSKVVQVSASLLGTWKVVAILRAGQPVVFDVRPLVRMNVNVVLKDGQKMESGGFGGGARSTYAHYLDHSTAKQFADEALRIAQVNLEAKDCPAGQMPVVLGAGWPGVLLHEAVGHGLEGDFNRKGISTFSNRMGEQVASRGVTVIDEGCIPDRRGSLNVDDEGTPTQKNVLIEDGKLVGYMQDRLNARLMGVAPTGNGRRESFAHTPMPRMTNTYMLGGKHSHEEVLSNLDKGIYAPGFSGGQVDITSGQFVFNASEAYMVEKGKILYPVKGATFIGNGPDVMQKIVMIGDNMQLDSGIGTCGKDGQSVPVGVGQPSMLISSMTIGGTEI